ncbi:hypothetical protein PV327_010389 [Microctonus hyperodae]|uniref:Uncharacterized protein n=1 Tax=Microctonus hyperodae TaxID=165561 RepID=A0AA39FSP2_MICHY|nr:hypothetical protein PV327_010389 [Microctonus hyperodae]
MELKKPSFDVIWIMLMIWTSIPSGVSWSMNDILFDWIDSQMRFYPPEKLYTYNTVCNTASCKQTGKILLKGLNKSANPCDDFYEFACGRWAISNPIPSKNLDWSCQRISESNIEKRSLEILESKLPPGAVYPSKLIREFYAHCMDINARENAGLTPINNITRVMGGWPLIGENSIDVNDKIKWQSVDQYYQQLTGYNSIFKISVTSDYLNRFDNQIMIEPGKFPRPEFFPLSTRWKGWPENDTSYTILVKKVAGIFLKDQNISYTKENFDNDIFDMLQFEYKLYQIQTETTNSSKDMTTIEELQQQYDNMTMQHENNNSIYNPTAKINWLKSIREIFAPWNFTINTTEKLFAPSLDFFTRLPQLLNTTKNKAIVNYIHWKFVLLMMPFTNDQMKELVHSGPGKIFAQTLETRRRDCLTEIRLTHVLYREYAQKYFPKTDKLDIANMAEIIRDETTEMIKNSHWLDFKTQAEIIEKIRDIHIMIGYPDWYDDNGTAIINYYKELIPGQSHFENTLNNLKFMNQKSLAEFRQPMEKYEWFLQPLTLNGLYKYYFNSLLVTMAFAQSPIYYTDLPIAVKYGLLGSIIGHEIFHALDPYGVTYNKDWKQVSIPAKTTNEYKNKINCIINQFDNYTLHEKDPTTNKSIGIRTKGNRTKNEDMADIEGIRVAFASYRIHMKQNEPSRLIGLEEFNSDKLFFISYANKWCQAGKIKWWEENYSNNKYDAHSPSRLRVNRPMSNFDEFAKTFNCPIGSNMNPQSKCIVFGGH